jgi:hypothetical protein
LLNGSYLGDKTNRKILRRNAVERWESKLRNSEITSHEIWSFAKSLTRRFKPKTSADIQSSSGFKSLPLEKANVAADYLENQYLSLNICDKSHVRLINSPHPGLVRGHGQQSS